jgi:scyllo-inositol 2-dehydrogenase (NADP+)
MIHIGIIGFGRIGNEHAAWLSQCKNARPVVVYDPTPQRRALAESRGLQTVDSLYGICADAHVDAVLISTPTAMHFEHASAALSAGKHVMVEKPITLDYEHSKKLADQARAAGKLLSVFHNRRWDIDYLTVQSAIRSGIFGKLINIESRLGQWSSCVGPAAKEYRPNWRNEKSFGGGGLYDWGSHFVDQIWQLMLPAKPTRVFAQLRGNVWTKDCDDFARVCIDFDNGAVAMVEINTTTTCPLPRWHIDGANGSADSPFSLSFDTNEWAKLTFSPTEGSSARLITPPQSGLNEIQIWDAFAKACQGNGIPAVSVESVLTTMKLMDAARESSASGNAVEFHI